MAGVQACVVDTSEDQNVARSSKTHATPASTANRIIGFDVARSIAIFGMVLVNYKNAMAANRFEHDWLAWFVQRFESRASVLFVVLAGVGLTLLSRHARESSDPVLLAQTRTRLLRRSLFLFVAGNLFYIMWPGDILHFYAVYFAAGALMFAASNTVLLGAALFLEAVTMVLGLTFRYSGGSVGEYFEYPGYWTPTGFLKNVFLNGMHPFLPWMSFMLIGMWLGRQDFRQPSVRVRIFLVAVGAAIIGEVVGRNSRTWFSFPTSYADRVWSEILGLSSMPAMPPFLLAAGGTAVAVIMFSLWLVESFPRSRLLLGLAAVGQISLTIYIGHAFAVPAPLYLLGGLRPHSLIFTTSCGVLFFVIAVVGATLWKRRFRHGPLEWVMRRTAG